MNARQLVKLKALAYKRDRAIRETLKHVGPVGTTGAGPSGPIGPVRPAGEEPLVAFVHIPKTAGGAVKTMFAAAYSRKGTSDTGNYLIHPERTLAKIAKRPGGWEDWRRGGGRIAIGHTPYGVFRDHLPPDTRYITFLRDPVDRVLSHYYRHVHLPGMSDADLAVRGPGKRARSLDEALNDMRLPQLCNLSTRFLCSSPTLGRLRRRALDEAKRNLSSFAVVGIQERFGESIVLLQRALGLGLVPYRDRHVSRAGHRPSAEEISDDERALIMEHNQLDAELYAFGMELFEEAVAAAAGHLATEVDRLRGAAESTARRYEDEMAAARAWLDRELPAGASQPLRTLGARAEAAGFSRTVLIDASRELLVARETTPEGVRILRRAGSATLTAVEEARAWLDRELPPGATEVREVVMERGEAAGHSREALNRARKLLSVNKLRDSDDRWVWSRPEGSR